jgi:hypothetical protein
MKHLCGAFFAVTLILVLGACSGGASTPTPTSLPQPTSAPDTSGTSACTITINSAKPAYSQPAIDSAIVGETLINTAYVVNGAWQQGADGTRWYPIAGFEAQAWVNVSANEYFLSPNCPG